ncbi:MAG: alpha/beta hydrolase [Acidobacteria bacterium]|nr:alpha/beta hydrolase [Acidobacteriota bacterium]
MRAARIIVFAALSLLFLGQALVVAGPRRVNFPIRGAEQTFYVYTPDPHKTDRPAVIVVSGDGGWHGFITEIAQYLADRGHTVVGVDCKAYLESLGKPKALEPAQITGDFGTIAQFAKAQAGSKAIILVGWSEGAGLAVLGGLDSGLRPDLRGVVAIGIPELNELAWRWSDATIYLTHKVPNEPTFNSKDYVGKLAPVPLMSIQSTRDEFVPLATAREIFARAQDPKRLALIEADGHHFDGQRQAFWQALERALSWFEALAAKSQS